MINYRYQVETKFPDATRWSFGKTTESFQKAMDDRSYNLSNFHKVTVRVAVYRTSYGTPIMIGYMRNDEDIQKHTKLLQELERGQEKMNRVQQRLVLEAAEHTMAQSLADAESFEDAFHEDTQWLNRPASDTVIEDELNMPAEYLDDAPDFHGEFDQMTPEQQDAVINPKHYKLLSPEVIKAHPDGMEYIDLMTCLLEGHNSVQAHLLGQIYKYSMRLGKKDNRLQDAKKIEWYAARLVKEIGKNDG